jgi:hypothetical protein
VFTRVKQSRNGEYLQIVENYRDGGRVRQRLVMYLGEYHTLDHALRSLPGTLVAARGRATRAERWAASAPEDHDRREEARRARQEVDRVAGKLEQLRHLAQANPELLVRDRKRAEKSRERAARRRADWN